MELSTWRGQRGDVLSAVEIRQLRYFSAVARNGGITKAAQRLRVAQPAVSRQIHALESELGVPLLVRTATGVVLTEAGLHLQQMADRILADIDDVRPSIHAVAGNLAGEITVGVAPSLFPVVAEPLSRAITLEHPKVHLRMVEGLSMFLCEWLEQGRLDLAIFSDVVGSWPELRKVKLARESLVYVTHPRHAPDQSPVTLSRSFGPALVLTPGFRSMLSGVSEHLAIAFEIDSVNSVRGFVSRGEYASVLPYSFVAPDVRAGLLSASMIDPPVERVIVAAARRDRFEQRTVQAVIQCARGQMKSIRPLPASFSTNPEPSKTVAISGNG